MSVELQFLRVLKKPLLGVRGPIAQRKDRRRYSLHYHDELRCSHLGLNCGWKMYERCFFLYLLLRAGTNKH